MSAATVISPVFIIFLEMNAYQTIEKALASDVLASAISAYTYEKIKIMIYRNVIIMILLFYVLQHQRNYIDDWNCFSNLKSHYDYGHPF